MCFAERNEHGWQLPDWLNQWGVALGYWKGNAEEMKDNAQHTHVEKGLEAGILG